MTMDNKKRWKVKNSCLLLIVFLIMLSACSPSVSVIEKAISSTEAAKPTQTARVIVVTPTNTPTQTLTPTPVRSSTPTQPPTNTPQPWQLTQAAAKKTQTYLEEFEQVIVRDFITYPDKYEGKKIKLSGSIFNINGNDEFQIFISGTSEAAYIISRETFDNLYENNYVTIYGYGQGETCFKNAYNAEICQPIVDAVIVKK